MGCGTSKSIGTYYDSMLRKIILYATTKYKYLLGNLTKEYQAIDFQALDDIGLFMTSTQDKGQRYARIEKIPLAGREVPLNAPRSMGHFTKFVYQMFGWPFSTAVIDLSLRQPVSEELVTAIIFSMNAIDICRTINFAKQKLTEYHSSILGAFLAKSINMYFLSIPQCGLNNKAVSNIAEGLLRMARARSKIETIARTDEIVINEYEAFLYEVPSHMTVCHGLRALDISRNNIGDFNCSRIIDSLTNHVDLEFLGLSNVGLGEETCKALYEVMINFKALKTIDLSDNDDFNDKCLAYIFKRILKNNFRLQYVYMTNTGVSRKYENKFCSILNRNQAASQAYEDILNGAFTRIFNTAEMAGQCHGKGSDVYIEYLTSEYYPTNLTPKEYHIMAHLSKEISIQENYIKEIATILANEKEEVNRQDAILQDYTISLSETIGRRPEMEDVCAIHSDFYEYRYKRMGREYHANDHYEILICLFDGHGGVQTAQQAGNLFPACFADTVNAILKVLGLKHAYQLPEKIWNPLMYTVFQRVDETLKQRKTPAGSTGVVCLILESWVVTANVGDSRAIMVREEGSARRHSMSHSPSRTDIDRFVSESMNTNDGSQGGVILDDVQVTYTYIPYYCADYQFEYYFYNDRFDITLNTDLIPSDLVLRLSKDHKPELPEEKRRVESVGGYIHYGRILSTLAVARSLGDHEYKPSVGNCPYVNTYTLQKNDAWLIVCCDGVWDVLSDIDAALLVHRSMTAGVAAITLRDEAFRLESGDNITAIAMRLFFK